MQQEQRSMIDELPRCLQAEGFETDLFFHEPGGGGPAPLGDIALYLQPHVVSGVIGGAAWAAISAVSRWARKYMRRTPQDLNFQDCFVSVNLYAGEGTHLSALNISADFIDFRFIHSAIRDESRIREESAVSLEPGADGSIAVATASGSVRCLVKWGWVGCETSSKNWPPHSDGTVFHGVTCDANGTVRWADGQIGDSTTTTIGGHAYQALGWTIRSIEDGLRFTNDNTRHGMSVNSQEVKGF
jgi:hypothetical protein